MLCQLFRKFVELDCVNNGCAVELADSYGSSHDLITLRIAHYVRLIVAITIEARIICGV